MERAATPLVTGTATSPGAGGGRPRLAAATVGTLADAVQTMCPFNRATRNNIDVRIDLA